MAQATNAYKPSATAIQSQIDSLAGRLEATNEAINRDYAQQKADLNTASNQAAETASMQAAGSGGSFGGAANIANRKYYEQSFVPAVTRLQTNKANDLAAARQTNEDTRNTLNQQLANLQSQAGSQALSQYYTDLGEQQAREFQQLEAEKNRQFESGEAEKSRTFQAEQADLTRQFQAAQSELDRQFNEAQAQLNREWQDYLADKQYKNEAVEAEKVRQFQAAQAELERQYNAEQSRLDREFQAQQNAASRSLAWAQYNDQKAVNEYQMRAAEEAKNAITLSNMQNVYGGYDWTDGYGNKYTAAQVASRAGGNFNESLYDALALAGNQGDYYSQVVASQMKNNNARFEPNTTGQSTGNDMYDTLGIVRVS